MFNRAVETRPWGEQVGADDAAFRRQIGYLLASSKFYQGKLAGLQVGGLADLAALPFTEKDELRASRTVGNAIGAHLAAADAEIVRIYSTSGTTGSPSYIPLTTRDLADWVEISSRSYSASGLGKGDRIITTYGAGPFVAGVTLDAFNSLSLCHIPVGAGNTEKLMAAVQNLAVDAIALTPSYALHLAEWAAMRGIDLQGSSVKRLLVAGEPGGGEAELRAKVQEAWGAQVTEAMGIGDISVSLWGECEARAGMHFSGRGLVHFELIDPVSGAVLSVEEGAEGELVYTHLRQQATPLLRFRSRDHVRVSTGVCSCGRTSPRVRCIGRTDDMLIVRGVNVFPSALREVVSEFAPAVSGVISIKPSRKGVKQEPPLAIVVEGHGPELAERIARRVRDRLIVTVAVELVPIGSLPRSDYKSKLVEWPKEG